MSDPKPTERPSLAPVAILACALLACAMYAPWIPRPFDVVDFAEFLPFLRGDAGPVERFGRFVGYYAGHHGRLNLTSYAALILKWEILGDHPMAWHWLRMLQSAAIVALVYRLARRLDASWSGAGAAALLFLVARPAAEGWFRLTLGEPLGLLLMLGAMLLAVRWPEDPSPRRGIGIALLIVLAVLAKEMLAGIAPWVFVFGGLRDAEGRLDPAAPSPDRRGLALWVGIPTVVAFGAAAVAAKMAAGGGFSGLYGAGGISVGDLFTLLARPWQLDGSRGAGPWWLHPANAGLLLLVVGGILAARRGDAAARRQIAWLATGAIGTSLAFAILYLPWPWAYAYYAMPFLLGPALLLAAALTAIERYAPQSLRWAQVAAGVMLLSAALGSAHEGRKAIALQRVNGDVVRAVVARHDADTLFALRPTLGPSASLGAAPTLREFALAAGLAPTMPEAADRPCAALGDLVGDHGGRVLIVTYLGGCGVFTNPPTVAVRDTVHYLDRLGRPREEVLGADLIDVRRHPPAPGGR